METRFWVVFCTLYAALALACNAAEVSPEEAARAAEAWCEANAGSLAGGAAAVSVRQERTEDGNVLWHEVSMADGGCAFVAPDDRINPVVAYVPAFEGPLPADHPLRAMLEADLGRRLAVLGDGETVPARRLLREAEETAPDNGTESAVAASTARAQSRWGELAGGTRGKTARAVPAGTPALVYSHIEGWATGKLDHWNQNGWNQYGSWDNLYDLYTPNHYPCGCVAAAGAALLQFFGVTQAPSRKNSCTVDGVDSTLAAKGIPYDWSILPETWTRNQSLSEAQIDLLGRATYDMGVCLGMDYAPDGSSASISTLASSLRSDFGMADARCFFSGVSATNYPKLVYHQLRAGAPVVLSLSGTPGGHAVLAVGYGEDDAGVSYTRVFMGWGGSSDGWYQLPEVDEFTTLDGIVTMLGADDRTLALCGRVTTADGTAAAFEKVTVSGVASATATTDENGCWAVRVKPAAGLVSVSCAGSETVAKIGAAAAAQGGSVGAAALAAALPGAIDLIAGQTDVLVAYSSPAAARLAALRQGKLLFLQMGAEWCGPCRSLREYLKGLGSAFTDDFVFCYLDTDKNAYGFDDDTFSGIPAWAVIDPRRFDPADHWTSEGILHKQSGYSAYSTDYWLADGRKQWKTLGAAPAALVVDAPATLAMPKTLRAFLRFPDGTESDVSGAVAWSLASGTAATLAGNVLSPVAGASGDVAVRCEGTFWNTPFSAGATVRVIGGVALEALEIEGPDSFDLYDAPSAQYTAVAVFSDGSRAEVDAEWSAETSGTANYMQCSADGLLSFAYDTYTVYQSVTVTVSAVSSGLGASRDVLVHGPGWVKPISFVYSQDAFWPGAEVSLVPQKVQWWRHGVLEPPTDDFSDVKFSWELYCWGSGWASGNGTSFTVPSDAVSTNGGVRIYLHARPARDRYYDENYASKYLSWHSAPLDLLAVDFDADGGTSTVSRVLRTTGGTVGTLPEVARRGCLFDGWFRTDSGAKVTASTTVTNAFACKAKWSRVVSVDILGPSAAAETSKFALAVAVEDGTVRTVTNGVSWSLASGDAAAVADDGMLTPLPGKSGNVELCASAEVGGEEYSLCKTVRIINASDIRSLRVEGPELIDLYDVPGGQYRAFATTASGEFEVTPAWSAEGEGASYMRISEIGELSFSRNTYTVYQCATATVTAVYCGFTNSASTLLYGPGYVTPVSFVVSQNPLWPGAEVTLVPQKVQWWRHGVLEPPTGDFADVEFSWMIYCRGSGYHYGNGTTVAVPSDAVSTNSYVYVYLYAHPDRDRYYDDDYAYERLNWHSAAVDLLALDFDANGGTSTVSRVLRTPGAAVGPLPETARRGYFFDGWFRTADGAKITASTTVTNAFVCRAKWSRVVSVDILGPSAAAETAKFALAVIVEDGTVRTVTNGVSWSVVSGDAAAVADDGTLAPIPGKTGNVEVCASAVVGGEDYSLCKTVCIITASDIQSLRVEGPDLIDLYDVPGGQYRAFATTPSGEFEVTPAWSAEGEGTSYMRISDIGELSFSRNTYTVRQCATATVTAAYGGLTNSASTLLYGPGYVRPVSFVFSQDTLWPGAEVTLVPQKVQWWRHGVLEPPTDDLTGVKFNWMINCRGSGYHYGNGTTVAVPSDAVSTNSYVYVYLYAQPDRDRYYDDDYDYECLDWHSAPVDFLAVDFDADGGTSTVSRVLRTPGAALGTLPEASRHGCIFNGWFRTTDGAKMTFSTPVTNSFACKAKWLRITAVDILGPSAAAETSKFALAVSLEDGTVRTVTNGISWSLASGTAAAVVDDGTLTPLPGKTGNVEVCASAVVGGEEYSLCKTVRILTPSDIRSLRIKGPELIDLYDVPGGQYRAYATTADGEYEVSPDWDAEGLGTSYMQISEIGELSFYYDTRTVYQCATATVTAVYCGLTNSATTLLYGPGYVTPVSVGLSQNALWPGARVELAPGKVRWWRHGVLEEPTDDFTDVEFSWQIYCRGIGSHYGNGTTVTVPADAVSTNGEAMIYLYAKPSRDRYYGERSDCEYVYFTEAEPAAWVTVSFDANGGESSAGSFRCIPGLPYQFLPALSRTGYSGEWWTERTGGSWVSTSSNAPTADATLHAQWNPIFYRLFYDPNGAGGEMPIFNTHYYDAPAPLRTNAFTMEGDSFAGWAFAPDGDPVFSDGQEILNLTSVYEEEITLYAVWPKNVYVDLAFDPNGGTVGETSRRTPLGKAVGHLPLPKNPGHAFAGWYTAAEGGTRVRMGMCIPGPATLYAHWAEETAPDFKEFALTNAATAIATAIREGKLLFVLHGSDGCAGCHTVKSWLSAHWEEIRSEFVVYYCNSDYDRSISGSNPDYGVFDPAAFNYNWRDGRYAYYDLGGLDRWVQYTVDIALVRAGRIGVWGGALAPLSDGATDDEVAAAVAAAGFADPGVARAIGGSANAFNAFVAWARGVKASDGSAAAGSAAVVADPHTAAAFLLGAERLFAHAPVVGIESLGFGGRDGTLSVGVAVRDGTAVVPVSAEKVGAMFEASASLSDWADATAPDVDASGTDADGRMRFVIRPGVPASGRFFLRIRK